MSARVERRLLAARSQMRGRDAADPPPVTLPGYGSRPVLNLGNVEAELLHAAGQMNAARAAKRRLLSEPERAAWHRRILADCVSCARGRRRFARWMAGAGGGDR